MKRWLTPCKLVNLKKLNHMDKNISFTLKAWRQNGPKTLEMKDICSSKRRSDEMIFTPSRINLYTSQMNLHGDIIQTNWIPPVKEQNTTYCFPVLFQLRWNSVPYHLESCSNLAGTRFQLRWNSSTDNR